MIAPLVRFTLICLLLGSALALWAGDPARFSIPYAPVAPVTDGKIGQEEWKNAVKLTGVTDGYGLLAEMQTTFMLCWDADHLYIAARSYVKPGVNLVANDGRSFGDSFEIGVSVMGRDAKRPDEPQRAYKFFVGPQGAFGCETFYPKYMQDVPIKWTPKFVTANRLSADPANTFGLGTRVWEEEITANRSDFELTKQNKAGDEWRFLLCRNTVNPTRQLFMPVSLGFFNPDGYISTFLTKDAPYAQCESALDLLRGKAKMKLAVANPGAVATQVNAKITLSKLVDWKPTQLFQRSETLNVEAGKTSLLELSEIMPDDKDDTMYEIAVSVTGADNATLLDFKAPYKYSKELIAAANLTPGSVRELDANVKWLVHSRAPQGSYVLMPNGIESRLSYISGPQCRPRLSPNRDSVLVSSYRGGKLGLWALSLNSSKQQRICDGEQGVWAPSGKAIAFQRGGKLLMRDFATGKETRISPTNLTNCAFPDFDKTGQRLCFVADHKFGRGLYILDIATGKATTLASGEIGPAPRWSPDAKMIAFQSGAHLRIVDLMGGIIPMPADGGVQAYPIWSADGNGLAYCQAVTPAGPWDFRMADRLRLAPSKLLKAGIDPGCDVVFTCKAISGKSTRPELSYALQGDKALLSLAKSQVELQGDLKLLKTAKVEELSLRIPQQKGEISISGEITNIVMPDRLGDDLIIENPQQEQRIDFSPVTIALLKDGAMLVLIAPESAARTISWGGKGKGLKVSSAAGPVYIGIVSGEGKSWGYVDGPNATTPAFPALWRITYQGPAARFSIMVQGGAKEVNEAKGEMRYFENEHFPPYVYSFGRVQQTPLDRMTVSDIVMSARGLAAGDILTQQTAATSYRTADSWTDFPTLALEVDSINQVHYWKTVSDKVVPDYNGWLADISVHISTMDKRIGEYADFAKTTRQALDSMPVGNDLRENKVRTAFAALENTLNRKDALLKPTDVAAACAAIKGNYGTFADSTATILKAGSDRESILRAAKQNVRELRNRLAEAMTSSPENVTEYPALYKRSGEVLAHRLLIENVGVYNPNGFLVSGDEWRGEPVTMPLMRGWWGDVLD